MNHLLTLSKELIVEPGHRESTILKHEEEFIKNIVYSVDKSPDNRYTKQVLWLRPRGVAVNMSPCHGEDRQFKSDRGRHLCLGSSVGRATD